MDKFLIGERVYIPLEATTVPTLIVIHDSNEESIVVLGLRGTFRVSRKKLQRCRRKHERRGSLYPERPFTPEEYPYPV